MNDMAAQLATISAVNVTPFDRELNVDFRALGEHLDFLVAHGMEVVVPCGNTGEFYALSLEECRQIVAFACERLRHRALVIPGVGYNVAVAREMACHAARQGCAAVMVHHPAHPYLSGRGYYDYVRAIADAVDIGVVPYVRAASIPDQTILDVVKIDNVVGVKYALNDLQRFGWLVANTPPDAGITWICGTAESWAPFYFTAGATGFTSGLVNVVPARSRALLAALRAGDVLAVRRRWVDIKSFEDLRARNGSAHNVSVVKEAMAQIGLGSCRVRPPLAELTAEERAQVGRILEGWA